MPASDPSLGSPPTTPSPAARIPRVLLAGRDLAALTAVRASLQAERRLEVEVAVSPESLRALLKTGRFDVVISHDEAIEPVLAECREGCPTAVRIVVLEPGIGSMSLVRHAHQVVAAPVDPATIEAVVDRALGGRGLISRARLLRIVGLVEHLPALPTTLTEVFRVTGDPDATSADVAAVLSRDPALAAKTLHMANSAFFALPRPVATLAAAVSVLGQNAIRVMTLAAMAYSSGPGDAAAVSGLRDRSLMASQIARRIGGPHASEAACASVLSNVGALLILRPLPAVFAEIERTSLEQAVPRHIVEQRTLGATYAQLGACLLALWGLPATTTEAVGFCRSGAPHPGRGADTLAVTFLACQLADEAAGVPTLPLDPDWCSAVGVHQQLYGWRSAAAQLALGCPGA